jgi:tetratricopeptide (TPR) repeat protein
VQPASSPLVNTRRAWRNEVLAIDPGKSKARYRRGLAYESLGKFQEAYEDLKQVRVNYKLLSHVRFVSLASISTPKQL